MVNIDSRVWWWDLVSRMWRQAVQVALPALTIASVSGLAGFGWAAFAWQVLTAVVVTVLRGFFDLRVDPGQPEWVQILDRAAAAGAGSLLGWWTADGFSPLHADWPTILGATAATVVVAVLAGFVDPGVPGGTVPISDDGEGDAGRAQVGLAVSLALLILALVAAPVIAPSSPVGGPDPDARTWASPFVPVVPAP